MKYIAVFDDAMLSNFRLDDADKLTLVMHDKGYAARAVRLKPLVAHILVTREGTSCYLTEGHIEALKEYEEKETVKTILDEWRNSMK